MRYQGSTEHGEKNGHATAVEKSLGEAQRAWKRGKLGCVWCTNLYEKTAVQLLEKKGARSATKKKAALQLGKKDWRKAPRAREAGLTVELLRVKARKAP